MSVGCAIEFQLKFGILRNILLTKRTNAVNCREKSAQPVTKKQSGTNR